MNGNSTFRILLQRVGGWWKVRCKWI